MILDEGFRNCITNENRWKKNTMCASQVIHDIKVLDRNKMRKQGLGSKDPGLYFIE